MATSGIIPKYVLFLLVAAGFGAVTGALQESPPIQYAITLLGMFGALYLAGEWAAQGMVSQEVGRAISPKKFSVKRVILTFFYLLSYFATFFFVAELVRD